MVLFVVAALGLLVHNTRLNMAARGIHSGFDFLAQGAGFDIGETLIAYQPSDPYWKAFAVGVLNTLRVAVLAIVAATLIGTLLGIGRVSRNALLRGLCYGYVELFRNVPLLLQLLMWYLLFAELLPAVDSALTLGGSVWLSKGGLSIPWPVHGAEGWAWSVPRPEGFSMEGGASATPEFLALLIGLSLYGASFIAEVVRAGLQSVARGQLEAAGSLGLSRGLTLRLVVIPQALRVIVPPLTSQYLNITKNSSLAVAVGYPDVVSIANTSLNQTGRAVECIAVIMAVYLTTSLLTAAVMGAYNRRTAIRER